MKLVPVVAIVGLFALFGLVQATQLDLNDPRVLEVIENREKLGSWLMQGFGRRAKGSRDIITCSLCELALGLALGWIRDGQSLEQVNNQTIQLCITLDVVPADVCEMIVPVYSEPIYFMVTEHSWLTVYDMCGFILGGELLPQCFYMNNTMTDWIIDVDYSMRPPIIEHPLVPADTPTVQIIHLTDIHPDLHYTEGSLNDCGKPMCCRPDPMDDPTNSSISAGHWGDFLCDFPIKSTENLFQDAASRFPDAEFVLMTGDLVHHQVWNTTMEDNLAHYAAFISALDAAFPSTQIYPAIGNHEPHPCNLLPPTEVWDMYDLSWMYNYHADLYTNHLSPEALETFRKGGYYTQLHKPGFRIVTLNTNFCYTFNFWVVYQPQDFEGHLQWFSDTMYAAERAGEKVWIVGHVPPGGSDCWNVWSIQFLRVINRYQNIILAQFYGHTHNDEFKVFFDPLHGGKPSGSLWIGASVTPYTELNPGYKVFYADGVRENATWQILDHETWIYDLATANEAGAGVQPEFYKEYSAREAYGMEGFRPQDLWDFVQRMALDDELFKLYYRHWFKNSGYDLDDEDCPSSGDISECKFDFLCSIVSTDYTSKHCDMLKALAKNA